jgi:hypothetical protein
LARRRAELERTRDREQAQRLIAEDARQTVQDKAKLQAKHQALLQQRDFRLAQLDDLRLRLSLVAEQERREGEAVVAAAVRERERAAQETAQRRLQGRLAAEQLRLANAQLKERRATELAFEQAQDEARIVAAAACADEAAARRAEAAAARRAAGDARRAAVADAARAALVEEVTRQRGRRPPQLGLSLTMITSSSSTSATTTTKTTTTPPPVDKRAALAAFTAKRLADKQAELELSREDLAEEAAAAELELAAQRKATKLKREAAARLEAVWRAQAEQRRMREAGERAAAATAAQAALEAVEDEQRAFEECERQVKEEATRRGMRVW